MNVGVIGGGWAGCVVARMLHDQGHSVMIYHDEPALGGMLAVGSLYGVPIDKGPHLLHTRDQTVIEWVDQFGLLRKVEGYTGQTVLANGNLVHFPPCLKDSDVMTFDPKPSDKPITTLKEKIVHRYGPDVWQKQFESYAFRLWGRYGAELELWNQVCLEGNDIPEESTVFPENEYVCYPVVSWREIVEEIWPYDWISEHVDYQTTPMTHDLIIDTSAILTPDHWRAAWFAAKTFCHELGYGVQFYADWHSHRLRTINQSLIARPKRKHTVAIEQYWVYIKNNMFDFQEAFAYPLPTEEAIIEDAWSLLPDYVWPFGRRGLHVYDSMAQVVQAARTLVQLIEMGAPKTPKTLRQLRSIVGGYA